MSDYIIKEIDLLLGKTIKRIMKTDWVLIFETTIDYVEMYHAQDCCEIVYIESIDGDLNDLIGCPILFAEEVTNSEWDRPINSDMSGERDSYTWTFYKISTNRGSVTIRWFGESNGYYSEKIDVRITDHDCVRSIMDDSTYTVWQ
jgi:hypothetical protein